MQIVTMALAAAVMTALAYTVLTERASYASVRRRQLDAWAAVVAFLCLIFLASGGHDVRQAYERRLALAQSVTAPVIPIGRRAPVSLRTPSPESVARPDGAVRRAESAAASGAAEALPVAPDAPSEAPRPAASDPERQPVDGLRAGDALVSAVGDEPVLVVIGTEAPPEATAVLAVPTAVRRYAVDPPPLIVPTLRAPTAPPSMPQPLPPATPTATATPECGSPDDIELALSIRDARADRSDGDLVVRYRVEVGNGAGFPVTLANINVTALNSAGGSETYGHATRPDTTVGAGASVVLEGGLRLDRSPGPFGRTELCISLTGDTCGRRSRYEAFRRCSTVNGF
ncbi:MAG: hypothetical protein IT332_05570 [Ardenticatenales bacterium]|nr:hypothetical protein [Ardenticatenales bacterium]